MLNSVFEMESFNKTRELEFFWSSVESMYQVQMHTPTHIHVSSTRLLRLGQSLCPSWGYHNVFIFPFLFFPFPLLYCFFLMLFQTKQINLKRLSPSFSLPLAFSRSLCLSVGLLGLCRTRCSSFVVMPLFDLSCCSLQSQAWVFVAVVDWFV